MRYLSVLVFATGAATLGMELSASRLLEPAFGNNQVVWATLIGMILLYLALGAWLGGILADRHPHRRALDLTITLAAIGVALIPLFSAPVLRLAATALGRFDTGMLVGALVAVLMLFSVPGVLLGTASPWAIRLAVRDVEGTGHVAGRFSAIATAGGLLGSFLPVLWLIPTFGTRWTFYILALGVLTVQLLGNLRNRHRWIPLAGILIVLALAWISRPGAPIRTVWDDVIGGEIIYEDESVYNYIAVRQWGSERHLELNDGVGIHSIYHPDAVLSQGIWDYFLLAPLFNAPAVISLKSSDVESRRDFGLRLRRERSVERSVERRRREPQRFSEDFSRDVESMPSSDGNPQRSEAPLDNMLLIGLAAGTISELFTDIYGPVEITGVELDPQIIEVGQRYFDMNQPNLTAIAADGRGWLSQQPAGRRWDMIAVDAYRPPYIPFHLTTVEFFELVRDHLSDDGVLAINVGRTDTNYDLVHALTTTLKEVFPTVYAMDEPGPPATLANTLVVATLQPAALGNLGLNVNALPDSLPSEFRDFAREAATYAYIADAPADAPIFTDDRAPVEKVVHSIIIDYLVGE